MVYSAKTSSTVLIPCYALLQRVAFKGKNPVVPLVEKIDHTGVQLTQKAMDQIKEQIYRLPTWKKWFVEIFCRSD